VLDEFGPSSCRVTKARVGRLVLCLQFGMHRAHSKSLVEDRAIAIRSRASGRAGPSPFNAYHDAVGGGRSLQFAEPSRRNSGLETRSHCRPLA